MDTKTLVFLFIFISFVPLIYTIFEDSNTLHMNNTLSYYIGDQEKRYAQFTLYFAFVSGFMLLFEYLVYKVVDFRILLLVFSTFTLLWIPEQEHFYTHIFFAVTTFVNVIIYMMQMSMVHKHYIYTTLTWTNILILMYIALFFRFSSVVNAEIIFVLIFLLFYWFHHKNTFQ